MIQKFVLHKAGEYVAAVPPKWLMLVLSCGRKRWAFVWLRKIEPGDEYLPGGEKEDETESVKK